MTIAQNNYINLYYQLSIDFNQICNSFKSQIECNIAEFTNTLISITFTLNKESIFLSIVVPVNFTKSYWGINTTGLITFTSNTIYYALLLTQLFIDNTFIATDTTYHIYTNAIQIECK